MNYLSIFDVIGPNMIGPSSSHTAGAVAIGSLAGKLFPEKIREVSFELFGSFASTYKGHGTDKALLGGVLGFEPDDIRIRDSFELARKEGLIFSFIPNFEAKPEHPNTVRISFVGESGLRQTVVGVSVGGGRIKITEIGGIKVSFTGEYSTLIINQTDKCGVAAHITSCLRDAGVNIAFLRIFRKSKGEEAYTVVESDNDIPQDVVKKIEAHPLINSVILVEI